MLKYAENNFKTHNHRFFCFFFQWLRFIYVYIILLYSAICADKAWLFSISNSDIEQIIARVIRNVVYDKIKWTLKKTNPKASSSVHIYKKN